MFRHLHELHRRVHEALARNAEIAATLLGTLPSQASNGNGGGLEIEASDDHTIWHYWNGQRWEPRVVARHKEGMS